MLDKATLERMEDTELLDRLRAGYFSEEARPVAEEILRKRGVDPDSPGERAIQEDLPQPAGRIDANRGVIANLWAGNYPLGQTYWLFGVLGGILVGLGVGLLPRVFGSPPASLVGLAVLCIWHLFICVSIWRSAGRYSGPRVWNVLARAAVLFGTFGLLAGIVEGIFSR